MTKALEPFAEFDENSEVRKARNFAANDIARTMGSNKAFPRARRQVFHRERQPLALAVDAGDDSVNFLILFEDVFRMLYLFRPRNVRDVNESVNTFLEFDKCTEISQIANAAVDL